MPIRIVAQPSNISTGEDMARAAPTGLLEGIASVAGGVGDLREIAEGGLAWLGEKAGRKDFKPKIEAPFPVRVLTEAARKRLEASGMKPGQARVVSALAAPANLMGMPSTRELLAAMEEGGAKRYEPQTRAGKYTRTIAQFAPAAAMPGSATRRIANALVPGAASEAAGQATEGTAFEPYARIAAAMGGGLASNLVGRGGPDIWLLSEASRGATDAQIAQARALMEQGQQSGVRLTMAEALQQVTNSATGMGRMQRVIEGTRAGNERVAPVMAQRPAQVRAAITDFADTIAPATDSPSMVGAAAQQGAKGALDDVRRFINSFAEPNYQALSDQEVPAPDFARLNGDPSFQQALQTLRNHPELGAQVANLPDNNLAVVNEVLKRLNTTADQARPGPMNPMGDNGLAALRDRAAGLTNDVASGASPEFRAAREGVAAGRQAYLEPLQRGPLGAISNTPDVTAQTGALFPTKPLEGGADETARALGMLNERSPDAASGLVRQQLVNSANEATQDLQGGANQWGGAGWAAKQLGNPEQARALQAGVETVGGDVGQMDRLVEVLRATGKRQPPGSLTAWNSVAIEELGKAGAMGELLRTGLNPPGVSRRIGQGFQDWQTDRNASRLAEAILSSPAEAEQILLHARRVVPPGEQLQLIERAALAAQLARQGSEQPQIGAR